MTCRGSFSIGKAVCQGCPVAKGVALFWRSGSIYLANWHVHLTPHTDTHTLGRAISYRSMNEGGPRENGTKLHRKERSKSLCNVREQSFVFVGFLFGCLYTTIGRDFWCDYHLRFCWEEHGHEDERNCRTRFLPTLSTATIAPVARLPNGSSIHETRQLN